MSRSLSSGMLSAVTADAVKPIILIELDFDSGATNLWSGVGELTWNNLTWVGGGSLLNISGLEETNEVRALGVTVTLSGLDSSIVSASLSEDYQGRTATIWVGAMDESGNVIADPVIVFGGRMDVMSIRDSGETASMSISIENRLIDFERSKIRRFTDQDQKIDYPTDKGFEYVNAIQNKEIVWGRK